MDGGVNNYPSSRLKSDYWPGVGSGTGAVSLIADLIFCCSNICCLCPSPYSVKTTMTMTVVIMTIKNRSGFFRKNRGHFGLIIPRIKKAIVKIPKLIAAVTMVLPVNLTN